MNDSYIYRLMIYFLSKINIEIVSEINNFNFKHKKLQNRGTFFLFLIFSRLQKKDF